VVSTTSQAERLAAVLATVPEVFLGIDLPECSERRDSREPAPRIAPGCVAAGRVDMLDVGGNRPTASILGPA
jgi:hypothetical protein